MGYPVYKLIRAINRQYPNNGFINYVDVTESIYNSDEPDLHMVIDEDLRDLINEAIQETYINIARDEVYSFPTVPGQKEYVLPDDCDLRDIQEVTRTFANRGFRGGHISGQTQTFAITFFNGEGSGRMDPVEVDIGTEYVLPECTFTPPTGYIFDCWSVGFSEEYLPGETISVYANTTVTALWKKDTFTVTFTVNPLKGNIDGESTKEYSVEYQDSVGEVPEVTVAQGYTLAGWTADGGETVVSGTTILNTEVGGDITYVGVFENVYYDISLYILTEGGTGILHYQGVDELIEHTLTMTYGGDTFDFQVMHGNSVGDVYTILEIHDSEDTFLASYTGLTPTSDREIGMAVPIIEPDSEQGNDNNDSDETENPISGGSSGNADPQDEGRDSEDSGNSGSTTDDNPLG